MTIHAPHIKSYDKGEHNGDADSADFGKVIAYNVEHFFFLCSLKGRLVFAEGASHRPINGGAEKSVDYLHGDEEHNGPADAEATKGFFAPHASHKEPCRGVEEGRQQDAQCDHYIERSRQLGKVRRNFNPKLRDARCTFHHSEVNLEHFRSHYQITEEVHEDKPEHAACDDFFSRKGQSAEEAAVFSVKPLIVSVNQHESRDDKGQVDEHKVYDGPHFVGEYDGSQSRHKGHGEQYPLVPFKVISQ